MNGPTERIQFDHLLPGKLRKDCGKPVKVILSPLVQRVVVAISTFHPAPHKGFSGKLGL